jgi:hypothetical protein
MRRTGRFTLMSVCVGVMLAVCASVAAQDNGGQPPRHRGFSAESQGPRPARPFPPDATFSFLGSEMHFGGATVKGAPYSATAVTESIQTLKDGNSITRKDSTSVYRDSDGRTRKEQTLSAIGPFAADGKAHQMTFIQDPVAGVHYVLDAQNKAAQKMKASANAGPGPQNRGPQDRGPQNHRPSASQAKVESLGTQVIEGVQAEGTRSTFTIPAGQIGNERAIEIVDERWYSSELQVVVLTKHSDPRMGEHVYRLTNISRAEPAKALFEVPSDYTVTERSFNRGPAPRGTRPPNNN